MDRPNSSYGGQSRGNALRNSRSPPRNEYRGSAAARTNSQGKPLSPLRSRVAERIGSQKQSVQDSSQMEEEMYERRRQGELRRQIEEKEREPDSMSSKHAERLNRQHNLGETRFGTTGAGQSMNQRDSYMHRSGSASGFNHQTGAAGSSSLQNNYRRGSGSPLRGSRDGSHGPAYTNGGMARSGSTSGKVETAPQQHRGERPSRYPVPLASRPPIPQHDNYVGGGSRQKSPKSPSALRQKGFGSRSPTRDIDMRDASAGLITGANQRVSISPVRTASNEYLSQLQQDNNSLQKRLNLVLQELDRVNRDRSNLVQKASTVDSEVNNLQRMLGNEDDADKMNNGLQLDLNGQRDNNVNVKRSIADTDLSRTDAIQKLRILQAERDRRTHMVDELKDDLAKKMQVCKQLEQQQFHAHEEIHALDDQISGLKRQALQDSDQIDGIQRIIDKLTGERDDLQYKLEQLNRTYDNCVREISRERAQMEGHNRHHNKLLVAKVTFCLLEQMFQRRKQEAMNEFFQYCKFDNKCHNTLKQFVKTIERLGEFRMRIAIKQWHQRTFKPLEMKVQESDLCSEFRRRHLLSRMFNLWRWRQQNADSIYGAKNRALQAIWNAKAKDCGKDVQRAFVIWRDFNNFQKYRQQRIKKLVYRVYSNKLYSAWSKWTDHSRNLQGQIRLHILAKTFAETQLKRITYNEMRFVLFDMRRKRLNRLRTYVKAWRESIQYKRFMVAANMTVLGFKKDCNKSMMKMCFDALRISKEGEKFMLMSEALEGDCMPAIESCSKQIEVKTQEAVRSGKKRGLDAIKAMVYRQVAEYFHKWKGVQQRHNVVLNDNIKGMIIRRWKQSMRDAFDLWKKGKAHQEIEMQNMTIMEMQEEGAQMQAAVEELDKKIDVVKKTVDRSGRKHLNRGTEIMRKRWLKQYFDKWSAANRLHNAQQNGGGLVLKKIRLRFLRQAFDLYKAGCAREQLEERNEGSCEHLKATLDSRQMRKCFNAIRSFNNKNAIAKRYWKILLGKMDHWMKKRAFGIWMDGGNTMKMEEITMQQDALTEEMTVKNNELGNLTKRAADKNSRNAQLTENLKKMGQRSMSNAFARMYYTNTARAFETWKESKRASKHKDAIIKRSLEHMMQNGRKFFISVFAKWKAQAGIHDTGKHIGSIEYEMNDMALVQAGQKAEYERQRADLVEQTRTVNAEFDKTMVKRSKMMALMTENNQNMHFQGRLRFIFGQWAAHTRRQRHFANCIKNVVLKSLWCQGFENIREFSRDKHMTRSQNTGLEKLRRMFWRRNCAAAFSKWRQTEYEQTMEMIEMTITNEQQMVQEHMQCKRVIQKQNITRSSKIVGKLQKQKFLKAWKNVTRWLKHKRVSTAELLEAQSSYACKRLIKRWRARKDVTIAARAAYEKFQLKRELIYKRAIYRAFMLKHHRDKALILRLSNAAKKYDNRNVQSAFQRVKDFATMKANMHGNSKNIASRHIGDILRKVYLRKLLQHYSHFRRQIHGDKVVEKKKKIMFGHLISASTRDAFMRWKKQAQYAQTVVEVNEIGPVVEQVLDQRLDVCNLRNLMTEEGFTQPQIEEITHKGAEKGLELMRKSIGRWKHWNGTDDYLKPKMFDRWRQFVQLRKIVRHWLEFMANRQQHQKADMSYCFNKWKFHFVDKQNALQKKTRKALMRRAVQAAKRLEVLADSTQQDEDMINHLSDQNEELFNNYRKSQRLALALGRDNHRFGQMKGFSILQDNMSGDKAKALAAMLGKNIEAIAGAKDKMKELENDNESLANENEELRQFSLDGYQLGKNVQSLTSEREKLSVDLADKANTIKKLLDENERLSMRLRQTQDANQSLLRQSMKAN